MRIFLIIGCMTGGCATKAYPSITAASEVAISLRHIVVEKEPFLAVRILNNSANAICINRDAIENPYSYEMELKLRYSSRHPVKYRKPGYIEEPLKGMLRLEPGDVTEGRYHIQARFKLRNRDWAPPLGLNAQATFLYHHCPDVKEIRAKSAWQRI